MIMFILFWHENSYEDDGNRYEDFETIEAVYKKIEELRKDGDVMFQRVVIPSSIKQVKAVETVIKYKIV